MTGAWTRRSVLLAAVAGSTAALTGCRVRLQDNAPRIPLLPTREPMPDERALLSALGDATSLQRLAAGLVAGQGAPPTSLAARLAQLHARQVSVLDRILTAGGVPSSAIAAAATTAVGGPTTASPSTGGPIAASHSAAGPAGSPAPAAPSSSGPPVTAAALAAAEVRAVGIPALEALASVSAAHAPLLGAMTAQRAAAGHLLAGAATWPATWTGWAEPATSGAAAGTPSPTGPEPPTSSSTRSAAGTPSPTGPEPPTPSSTGSAAGTPSSTGPARGTPPGPLTIAPPSARVATTAAALLAATRAAVYGFEVVATHIDPAGRRAASTALAALQGAVVTLQSAAGSSAGAPPLGYVLPFPVTTSTAARRLARQLLLDLRTATASGFGAAAGDAGAMAGVAHWLADVEVLASGWGVPLSAFPGLANA